MYTICVALFFIKAVLCLKIKSIGVYMLSLFGGMTNFETNVSHGIKNY